MSIFQKLFSRFIIAKFLIIFVPIFLAFTLLALYAIADRYISDAEDIMASRIGSHTGKISSLISGDSINQSPEMVSKLTSTLLADPAVNCIDILLAGDRIPRLAQPRNLGCKIMKPERTVEVKISGNNNAILQVGFTDAEIVTLRQETLWLAIYTALFGSMGAVGIGSIGFSYSVGSPIRKLKKIMETADQQPEIRAEIRQNNEIGELCSSFNALQDRIAAEQLKTKHTLENLSEAYNGTPALLFTMCSKGTVLSASEYWLKETGYSPEDVVGKPLYVLLCDKGKKHFHTDTLLKLRENEKIRDVPLNLVYRDGRKVDVLLSIDKDRRQNVDASSFVCVMNDVSQLRRAEKELYNLAITDQLTSLPNRRGLAEHFNAIETGAFPEIENCTVLFIDLDNFKTVNDTYGHQIGDEILRVSAERIKNAVGQNGLIARIGGDEFAVALTNKTDIENAETISDALISALNDPIKHQDITCFVGASVGIAVSNNFPSDLSETLRLSDQAMYIAKSSGKNQTCTYDPKTANDVQSRAEYVQLVQHGLDENAFDVHFQPIIDLNTQRPYAFETLLRVTDTASAPSSIETLIRIAEETGQMEKLGTWIFKKSVSNFQSLLRQYPECTASVTINLSPQQLTPNFVALVKKHIAARPLMAGRLIFEITETAAINNFDNVCGLLHELRDIGIRIALDDFGSGYSCLSYLNKFPIDILKLDKSFVQSIANSGAEAEKHNSHLILVRALANLANDLGMDVVAEGVETVEIMEIYHQLGINLGQGYLFSRPMATKDTKIWLKPYANHNTKMKLIA